MPVLLTAVRRGPVVPQLPVVLAGAGRYRCTWFCALFAPISCVLPRTCYAWFILDLLGSWVLWLRRFRVLSVCIMARRERPFAATTASLGGAVDGDRPPGPAGLTPTLNRPLGSDPAR